MRVGVVWATATVRRVMVLAVWGGLIVTGGAGVVRVQRTGVRPLGHLGRVRGCLDTVSTSHLYNCSMRIM